LETGNGRTTELVSYTGVDRRGVLITDPGEKEELEIEAEIA
jgi:hypothetical protein